MFFSLPRPAGAALGLPAPYAHQAESSTKIGFMRSVPWWTRSLRSLGPARARQRVPRQPALIEAPESRLSRPLRPAPLSTPPPRAGAELFLCVRSLRSHVAGTRRQPASSHKNEFCLLRPPGARPPFRRYACPPRWASAPQGAEPVGRRPTPARRASHGFRPSAVYEVQVMRRHSWQASRQASQSLSLSRLLRLVPP